MKVFPITLIVMGIFLLLGNLGIFSHEFVLTWWPAILILAGIALYCRHGGCHKKAQACCTRDGDGGDVKKRAIVAIKAKIKNLRKVDAAASIFLPIKKPLNRVVFLLGEIKWAVSRIKCNIWVHVLNLPVIVGE